MMKGSTTMGELTIKERQARGVSILDLHGNVTVNGGSYQLRSAIKRLSEQGKRNLLINLAKVIYVDSSGLGNLVWGFTEVGRNGGEIKLLNLTRRVKDLMVITKLLTVFPVFEDELLALRSFEREFHLYQAPEIIC